jgi:hypothetical protein
VPVIRQVERDSTPIAPLWTLDFGDPVDLAVAPVKKPLTRLLFAEGAKRRWIVHIGKKCLE